MSSNAQELLPFPKGTNVKGRKCYDAEEYRQVAKIVLEYYNLRQENNLYEVEVIELREALVLRTEQVVQFRAAQSMLQAELQIERDVRKTYQERAETTTRKAKIMKVLAITGAVVAGGLAVGLVVK